jgi:endoglucanase
MGVGWNLGNSLEAIGPGDETAWGNPVVTQELINAVKAAGFDTIRIPVAWSVFSDETTFTIDTAWLDRVEEVVNYALNAGMYVIINEHWDGGWIQPTDADKDEVNLRLAAMWEQIATHFITYDERLLFAGTNEVMVEGDFGTPIEEYYTAQNSFNQTFVDTVRATGENNATRYLIVQGFNTNIGHTVNFAVVPTDPTDARLMMEVHYYDPYQFTIFTDNDNYWQWGAIATNPNATAGWGNEDWVDAQFQAMKTTFVDQGIPVILGEYGVVSRPAVAGHEAYRAYWNEYITQSAVNCGMVPIYWDNGFTGEHGMAIFNRTDNTPFNQDIIDAIISAVP